MSIPPDNQPPNNFPPNNPPPGGYYSAPPPKKSGNGWKIAGFGCLGLFLLAAVGGVLLVRNVKNNLAHPNKNSIIGIGVIAGQTGLQGRQLAEAVAAYHVQHKAYPKTLMDLYSDGSIDGKLLHNQLDDSADPAHVSWRYTPPAEGAPGSTPILEEDYHITYGGGTAPGRLVINLDGTKQPDSTSRPSGSDGPAP